MKKQFWLMDADMTLFDFEKAEAAALRAACTHCGIEAGEEVIRLYHGINDALWKRLERGEVTQERLRVQRFEELLSALGREDDPRPIAARFAMELGEGCYLFPQSLSLMQNLHARCRVAVLTNGIAAVQKRRMALSGLSPYVDALVISEEVGFSKPDPRAVEAALQALGCEDKARAVIVGDSLTSDMLAAQNAGVDGIWYNPRRLPRPDGNPFIRAEVTQLHDLMHYV